MMFLLYSLFSVMLICSVGLLAIPLMMTRTVSFRYFLFATIFLLGFSFSVYQWTSHSAALEHWLVSGQKHYRLQEEVSELGGVNGIIKQIKVKLADNPDDAAGWFILGKLYFAKEEYSLAKEALSRARALRPNDDEIKRFYGMAVEKAG